eukprot:NODE_367_length_2862_cov_45.498357_g312_i0.p1 GENE.NODE_367_length_2862_cov_45.498357_g312_i0~~NODE_367_length_2862_cov_45.498357_g312_i0.p1  ORF type:complete len:891 (+),score=195.71 NODE_367_length_2862_cov_45.498357_g312_i0:155-2674(+)
MFIILKNDSIQDLFQDTVSGECFMSPVAESDLKVEAPLREELGFSVPVVLGGIVVSGVSSLVSRDRQIICDYLNKGLVNARDLKGDLVLGVNTLSVRQNRIYRTPIILVDCSPVYSKSMHNLRDIANSVANRHKNIEYTKSNLTRLVQQSFSGAASLRLIVHCKVSSFDLDLFDSLSSLNFSSLVMKIQKSNENEDQSTPSPPSKRTRDAALSPFSQHTPTPMHDAQATISYRRSVEDDGSYRHVVSPRKIHQPERNAPFEQYTPTKHTSPNTSPMITHLNPALVEHVEPPNALVLPPSPSVELGRLHHSQITSLIQQLKEKDENYRKALEATEQVSSLLQQERMKSKKLEEQNDQLSRTLKQVESRTLEDDGKRLTDDVATFVECTDEEEQYVLSQGLPTGSSASAILSPLRRNTESTASPIRTATPAPFARTSSHTQQNNRSSPVFSLSSTSQTASTNTDEEEVIGEEINLVNQNHNEQEESDSNQDSNSSGSASVASLEMEQEDIRVSSDDAMEVPSQLKDVSYRKMEEKLKKYKKIVKSYTAQLNHQTYLANHYSNRLEEEEKKSQEHIQKTIALSTRLEETKKWVRKLKKAVLSEKERTLPSHNEALAHRVEMQKVLQQRQEHWKRQCDTFIEQQNALTHELNQKCEKVEALEATVHALSNEYNRKLTEAINRDPEWNAFIQCLNPQGVSGWALPSTNNPPGESIGTIHMQLKLENEVLRSNIQGVMQVIEHCYEENARLNNMTAKLSQSLAEVNGRFRDQNWDLNEDEEKRHRKKEEKYLKQIADLHFTVLRLRKQLNDLGVETQDINVDDESQEEEEELYEERHESYVEQDT